MSSCPPLRPAKNIVLTHRAESKVEGTKHLNPLKSGQTVLVLEDFYDDLESAAKRLVRDLESGETTNNKADINFIEVVPLGTTSNGIVANTVYVPWVCF